MIIISPAICLSPSHPVRSERFVNIDRETPMLFPADMQEWLPDDHLVHFIIDAIEQIGVTGFKVNYRGIGDIQYPPWKRRGPGNGKRR